MGVKAELTVLGQMPPQADYVKALGFIDKSTEQGRAQFESIFAQSHFLLLPARAEAYGLVLCEANSFGVPCLASNVGGIPTIVRDGINGQLFPPESPRAIAETAARLFNDRAAYDRLAESSFAEYEARLNWGVAGRAVRQLLESL